MFSEAEVLRPWLSFLVKMVLADPEGLIVTDRPQRRKLQGGAEESACPRLPGEPGVL